MDPVDSILIAVGQPLIWLEGLVSEDGYYNFYTLN